MVDDLLAAEFAGFVDALLSAEAAMHPLAPDKVVVTSRTDDPDGGIDAHVLDAPGSKWVPAGESLWQFKKGDITPKDAAAEIKKPEVLSSVKAGASYVLCVGTDLTPLKVRNRKSALVKAAGVDSDRIRVYNASHLAEWATGLPAVLGYPPLRVQVGFTRFDQWQERIRRTVWTPSRQQQQLVDDIRAFLRAGGRCTGLRVFPASGRPAWCSKRSISLISPMRSCTSTTRTGSPQASRTTCRTGARGP
jgi:hypothetical protein